MVDDVDDPFRTTPLAENALAGQDLSLLTADEARALRAYAYNHFEQINSALWGDEATMTALVIRNIALIRSGLAKFPVPEPVRVTREALAESFGLRGVPEEEDDAQDLVEQQFLHRGFMSTSGSEYPPRSIRRRPGVIVDLIVPTGTPALRLGRLAPIKAEREVLLIDARRTSQVVSNDHARSMWRIQGFVREA
ncbi:ADP-ribosyltransferase [Nocardia sp. NPDC046763]|uniref:ADP-ribosyltransferase n=1 Tax=Nocardia sp. NPDC046763 TaxID=3155256 RepID=UPI0033C37F19